MKKALQKKMPLKKEAKAKGKQEGEGSQVSQGPKLRTLFQELEMTSEAVVGLEFITEFSTGDKREPPLYHGMSRGAGGRRDHEQSHPLTETQAVLRLQI